MRLFAPLYLSNECINNCAYCGFSRDNAILRVTLDRRRRSSREARHLAAEGSATSCSSPASTRSSSRAAISKNACARSGRRCRRSRSKSGRWRHRTTRAWWPPGAEGLVVYQETYDRAALRGACTPPDRRRISTGGSPARSAAMPAASGASASARSSGLRDWRTEALALAAHLEFLQNRCWKAQFTVAFPRLRPAAGGFRAAHPLGDREFVQLLCAFRLCFPQTRHRPEHARTGAPCATRCSRSASR